LTLVLEASGKDSRLPLFLVAPRRGFVSVVGHF
jgi:hypothetical protein